MRVFVAAVLGMAVGVERELQGQSAGVRTHGLVACGAALFTVGGAYGFPELARGPNIDPMRVAAQIASGIGFVGAGAILRDGTSVRGLTTAASLWASAALGLVAGAALWSAAVAGIVVVLGTLVFVRFLRPHLPGIGAHMRQVRLDYDRGHGTLGPVIAAVQAAGGRVADVSIEDGEEGDGRLRHVELSVRVRRPEDLERLMSVLEARPEVHHAAVSSWSG